MTADVFQVIGQPDDNRAEKVALLSELGFAWADLEDEAYWLDQIVGMRRDVCEELFGASERLWLILDKTARYILGRRDLYQLLGIPDIHWDLLDRLPVPPEGLISRYARFDYAISADGKIKMLELNADTPTGYVEASIATPWLCERAGIETVNDTMKERVASAWSIERPDTAACVAYGSHLEDSGTIEALVKHSGLRMNCVDCLDLWVDNGLLKNGEDQPIHRMFALYPKEWMAHDDGGEALAYAIEQGNLQLFNGMHSILLQSKGLQAAAWGLYELGLLFDAEERDAIGRYMLPTYNKPVFEGGFVSKSMFGREGGSVKMFDESGQLEVEDRDGFDTSELFPVVYQKRADLARIETAGGEFHLLVGMFVIDGKPCGLLGRAGGPITGNASHFIPIGVL
ncbi:glutathionylspermidine synthase family protein [Paenibacillus sacheonensis]|uniref:Glutathionylspermidine synthase family protein n=1 Tax=Paenibacillus sacheonensis TaxID=742054 RepID=A0A7X4YVR1_9BACL|nr:glutathionylspermidine synthase family protein [Paenibacillus sacheonensis]MBM7568603.1 glutathionylspermidine synthase [Paenibacillus sacheonensis]NBC72501.1 glutathionylspermidine synthase family protein [Paenibacillus sacheonensis]